VEEKKIYGYKNFCVYFTYLSRSLPWADLHEILREKSSTRRNQPCQILSQSGQSFFDSVGVEFLASPYEREVAVNTWLELPFNL